MTISLIPHASPNHQTCDDLEAQVSQPQQAKRSNSALTALKVGATALCGAALAVALVHALKSQTRDVADHHGMRMLADEEEDPCAEFNKDGPRRYVPLEKSDWLETAKISSIVCGAIAAPCVIGTLTNALKDGGTAKVCACLAAVPTLFFAISISGYFTIKGMQDGECWDPYEGWEGSRG